MNWKSIVGTVAPTIATALGGPMAGAAVKFLGDQFLGDENASEKKVAEFVQSATPDQLLHLKKADQEFAIKMEELGVDVFKLEVEDKKDARRNHKDSKMPAIMTVVLTLLIAAILWALFYVPVPDGAKEVLFFILGIVTKEWANSLHYWYGTTKGSADKNLLINGGETK
jgi:K+-sensing histidine kinase KdpD